MQETPINPINPINELLKLKRSYLEEYDKCFMTGKYFRNPIEVFHPEIGFVTISKTSKAEFEKKYYNNYEKQNK